MNDILKAILPTIVELAAQIPNCQVFPSKDLIADLNEFEDNRIVFNNTHVKVYWAKQSTNLEATLEFRLELYADRIVYQVTDFSNDSSGRIGYWADIDLIEWTDPQCLDKITKILTDMQNDSPQN